MIQRTRHLGMLAQRLREYPVVAIVGARQVGKTTLAEQFARRARGPTTRFDLENPSHLAELSDPMLALERLRGLVILDEIQRRPELFPVLRVLADRPRRPARFLVLGSAAPELLRQSSESLAGRIAYHRLDGFDLDEVGVRHLERLWRRGGFPPAYLAPTEAASAEWRTEFIDTFLQRDLPQLGVSVASETMRRFWSMLAHWHGQLWNSSEFGRTFGVSDTTVRRYLDWLTSALVVRQLQPWYENLSKRQVKAPRVYISDSGLLHVLLGIRNERELHQHPKSGASWEGFLINQIIHRVGARDDECHFWRTHAGAELDLLITRGRVRVGYEIKRTVSPAVSPSMRAALADLRLKHLYVVHAGEKTFPLARQVTAVGAVRLLADLQPLR